MNAIESAEAEVERLKKHIASLDKDYHDLAFVNWQLSCAQSEVEFLKNEARRYKQMRAKRHRDYLEYLESESFQKWLSK